MEKKMRGIADPFTLGLIIALLGSVTASNMTRSDELTAVQASNPVHVSQAEVLAYNEEEDE